LESKPNLVSTVVADLPEVVFMESIELVGKTSSAASSSSRCRHEKGSEIEDAIREMPS